MRQISIKQICLSTTLVLFVASSIVAQGRGVPRRVAGSQTVYGDITVDESQATHSKALSLDLLLYNEAGILQARQTVPSNGRYRFINLNSGRYYIVVELENSEIARFNVDLSSPLLSDVRQDLAFQLRDSSKATKAEVISAADTYDRPARTASIFDKAIDALKNKRYDLAISLLRQVVETDAADFQAWSELGTAYFILALGG
jgi:Flp pilus assembly protein TadD